MQFDTTCPKDHVIRCTLEMAGKVGHCPKCSEKFEIPTLAEIRASFGDDLDPETDAELKAAERKQKEQARLRALKRAQMESASRPAEVQPAATPAPPVPETPPVPDLPEEETIHFLCPNGHELAVTTDKAGKVGKCPECGAKFRVPELDTEPDTPKDGPALQLEAGQEAPRTSPSGIHGSIPAPPPVPSGPSAPLPAPPALPTPPKVMRPTGDASDQAFLFPGLALDDNGELDLGLDDVKAKIPAALTIDPMAKAFWTLWNQPEKPAKILLITADGKTYIPVTFEEDRSLGPIGVFEAREPDGDAAFRLIIRWDNVVRMITGD